MKRFLKLTCIFIVIAVLIYPFFLIIWGLTGSAFLHSNLNYAINKDGHMYTRIQELKQRDSVDVLIVGSSHAFRGIDTRILESRNIHAFNLGSSSQTPIQTELLFKRHLDRIKPRVIIYVVYPYFFSVDGVESALNIIGTDKNDKYFLEMAREINNLKVYNTLAYGFFRDLFNMNNSYIEPITQNGDTYIKGGFVERDDQPFHNRKSLGTFFDFQDKQWKAFERSIRILKEKDINYVLISAPITTSLYNSYTNWSEFYDRIQLYGMYYNFNEILSLDDTLYFYDPHHLNQSGVEIFTNALIDKLNEGFVLNK